MRHTQNGPLTLVSAWCLQSTATTSEAPAPDRWAISLTLQPVLLRCAEEIRHSSAAREGPRAISPREHCDDGSDHGLAILEGVHRNLADAIAIVNANLADMAVAIAARYADFPDRSPAHLAMVAKREP
jgi:hypothetical protein